MLGPTITWSNMLGPTNPRSVLISQLKSVSQSQLGPTIFWSNILGPTIPQSNNPLVQQAGTSNPLVQYICGSDQGLVFFIVNRKINNDIFSTIVINITKPDKGKRPNIVKYHTLSLKSNYSWTKHPTISSLFPN